MSANDREGATGVAPVRNLRALLTREQEVPGEAAEAIDHGNGPSGVIQWIREQLAQDPMNADLKDWLASLLYSSNQIEEAKTLLVELIGSGHSTPARQYQLACCLAMRGRLQEAMGHWEEVILTAPGSISAQRARERLQNLRESQRTI